ncbi:hypothetical protein L2E82_25527 [Cichorium intybus]|uniref:Uncharacterized protein n=1 Tax=Cichorium intybus TaxID=13427 RepID=A0ACB9E3A9_CICIN|nr:hypothetical protein L2E82_25527 [Cichorium intybus]
MNYNGEKLLEVAEGAQEDALLECYADGQQLKNASIVLHEDNPPTTPSTFLVLSRARATFDGLSPSQVIAL